MQDQVQNDTVTETPAVTEAKAPKAKRERKPTAPKAKGKQAPKAAKVSKPANAEQAAKREAAQRDADAMRKLAATFYAGASLAAHKAKPAPRDLYVSRALQPVQQPANGVASTRDESGLALILSKAKGGVFDPMALNFDVGILSRLASLKFIEYAAEADEFRLTKSGSERARVVVKRAA